MSWPVTPNSAQPLGSATEGVQEGSAGGGAAGVSASESAPGMGTDWRSLFMGLLKPDTPPGSESSSRSENPHAPQREGPATSSSRRPGAAPAPRPASPTPRAAAGANASGSAAEHRTLHLVILGDRTSGRTALATQLHNFCREHRRGRDWRRLLSRSPRGPRPPGVSGYGSHVCDECELAQRTASGEKRVRVSVTVMDPGPVGLDSGVAHAAAAVGANVVCCVLSLVGIKQVRERVGRGSATAMASDARDASRTGAVIIHDEDVRRVVSMLRIASVLRAPAANAVSQPVTVVLIGSFADALTDTSVAATREVLKRLHRLCDDVRCRDHLALRLGSPLAVNLTSGECVVGIPPSLDVQGGTTAPNSPFPLSRALRSLFVGAPLSQAGEAVSAMESAAGLPTRTVALLRDLRGRAQLPPVIRVELLERVGFALHQAVSDEAEVQASIAGLAESGEMVADAPRYGESALEQRLCLFPALLVTAHAFVTAAVRTALGRPSAPTGSLAPGPQLGADERVLLESGIVPPSLLRYAASSVLSRYSPKSESEVDVETLLRELCDLLVFSGFGQPCSAVVHETGARFPHALYAPSLSARRVVTPAELLHVATRLAQIAEGSVTDPAFSSAPHLLCSLAVDLSSSPPPYVFQCIATAVVPLVVGSPFSTALWLRPPCDAPAGVLARALLYTCPTDARGDARRVRLLCLADSNSPETDLTLALLEQHVLRVVGDTLARLSPLLRVCLTDSRLESAGATAHTAPYGKLSAPDILHRLERFFMSSTYRVGLG